ncbi:MAG: proline dehydrogenase family protein [Planctomycetaceae bacterium]
MDLTTDVFRPAVIRVAHDPRVRALVTGTTPGRAVASRFVAGDTLAGAMQAAAMLDREQIATMLDHLGENVGTPAQAEAARDDYLAALKALRDAPTLDGAVSVKLTQLGLDLSEDLCREHLDAILRAADAQATLVMIDMEGHGYVDRTLEVFRATHAEHPRVGVCLQSYLRRSDADVFALPQGCRIRLVKGAYLEPPGVVYTDKREVDASYARLFATLLARGHAVDAATQDPRLLEGVRTRTDAREAWGRVELQMLYGIRRDLQVRYASQGYPVRVYVPYGTEWYPYLTRRMAERPANVWFFLSNLVRV